MATIAAHLMLVYIDDNIAMIKVVSWPKRVVELVLQVLS
jgi:hypothetical protein